MKYILIACTLAITHYESANCQTIIIDKTDPFTSSRMLITSMNSLYKFAFTNILQVSSQLDISNDSITDYKLNFYTPPIPAQMETKDSIPNACLLKDDSNNVYNGVMKSDGVMATGNGSIQGYVCMFSKNDFEKILLDKKITDVKITTNTGKGGVFHVDDKFQDNILKQGKVLYNKIKNPK